MAKDVITRFKLETTQYDSAIKNAAKGLTEYSRTASNAGKEFDKFTKSNVEAAKALGTMATNSTNVKDKVKELVGAYNEATKAYNELSDEQKKSDWAKALAGSLTQLQGRIKEAKQEMHDMSNAIEDVKSKSKGLFGEGGFTGMLQVAGGNLMAQGITAIGSAMADTVQQGIELARQGEGIRAAFERLNKPGLLDNLREATHGTVADLDLMAQAVKFDNFGLSLEQMGTMLAFAQQQAKDTGQSVDYMVDSIVTGLGRKSLPILDNLGLSAAEIRERMKESGDMTKAVADIIKERMEAAGGYVETAADRAARAAATAKNEMENLGREAIPVAEEWAQTWATLTQGAMTFAQTLLGPVATSIRSIQNILNTDPDSRITGSKYNFFNGYGKNPWGDTGPGKDNVRKAPGGYVVVTDRNTGETIGGQHFDNLSDKNSIKDWQKNLFKTSKTGGRSGSNTEQTEYQRNQKLINDLVQQYVALEASGADGIEEQTKKIREQIKQLEKRNSLLKLYEEQAHGRLTMGAGGSLSTEGISKNGGMLTGAPTQTMYDVVREKGGQLLSKNAQKALDNDISKQLKRGNMDDAKKSLGTIDAIGGNVSNILSGIQQLGIQIPEGIAGVVSGINTIVSITSSILTLVALIQSLTASQNAASWVNAILPFKNGGIVPHAATGMIIPGNDYSDRTPVLAQSGELILNRAQQGNLAAQLQGGGMQGLQLSATIRGEDIRLVLNNNGRRTGRGEYVTSTNR